MNYGTNNGCTVARKSWAVLLVCVIAVAGAWSSAQAALLDGLLSGVEESLAERVAKKGEKLTVGNFYTPEKPNAHGPIGMMGEHTHNEGELMFTYKYMQMIMKRNRDGTNQVSDSQIVNPAGFGFIVTPTDMTMEMHMFSGMYGLTDTVTLTLMVPYIHQNMNHVTRTGVRFETESTGLGDIRLGSLWRLWAVEAPSLGTHRFHFNFALSVPTGDIEARDGTPLGNTRLPYPMQLGSGTVDFYPGLTYTGEMGDASWGFQTIGILRVGRNNENYSKGDAYNINAFGGYAWTDWISNSLRFNWLYWGNYDGQDLAITAPTFIPTADPNLRGGERLDFLIGTNILFPEIMEMENRLAIEAGLPIYQKLDGPQLETDWIATIGWQAVF